MYRICSLFHLKGVVHPKKRDRCPQAILGVGLSEEYSYIKYNDILALPSYVMAVKGALKVFEAQKAHPSIITVIHTTLVG